MFYIYISVYLDVCVCETENGLGSDSIDFDRYVTNWCSLGSAVLTFHKHAVKLD